MPSKPKAKPNNTPNPWPTVRDFGAVGDGAADDTQAIQSAINSVEPNGGTILVPIGQYRITEPLFIANSYGVHLVGQSQRNSLIQADPVMAGGGPLIQVLNDRTCSLERLHLQGAQRDDQIVDAAVQFHRATSPIAATQNIIRDCLINGDGALRYGIRFTADVDANNDLAIIEGTEFNQCQAAAIRIQHSNSLCHLIHNNAILSSHPKPRPSQTTVDHS